MGKYLDVGKRGTSFDDVVRKVRAFYMSKGYSYEEANEIAHRVAGKVFWTKFGPEKGREIIRKARRRARASRRRRR